MPLPPTESDACHCLTRRIRHCNRDGAVLLLITVVLAVWGLRRSLRPLAELAGSASAISTANWELNPSEAARETKELAPLTAGDDHHA